VIYLAGITFRVIHTHENIELNVFRQPPKYTKRARKTSNKDGSLPAHRAGAYNAAMNDNFWELLPARRHVGLRRLAAPGPDADALVRILEAAAQAPDHGLLRPWRFVLIPQGRRAGLGAVFEEALARRDPGAAAAARAAARAKADHAPCLLVAILVDAPGTPIPAAEKLVSLGCAVQNMLLAAQALDFASGLASGAALDTPAMRRLLRLDAHEQAVCFIGLGTAAATKPPRVRPRPDQFFSTL
jgi:nitroreductase